MRASAGDDRGLAVGGDREAVHGAAALGDGEFGLSDEFEGVGLEGRQGGRGLEGKDFAALGELDREQASADVDERALRVELLTALQDFAGLHAGVHPGLVGHGGLLVDVGSRGGGEGRGQQEPGGEGGAHKGWIDTPTAAFKGAIDGVAGLKHLPGAVGGLIPRHGHPSL